MCAVGWKSGNRRRAAGGDGRGLGEAARPGRVAGAGNANGGTNPAQPEPGATLLCLNCPEKTHSPWERFVSPGVSFSTAPIDSFLYATALILTDLCTFRIFTCNAGVECYNTGNLSGSALVSIPQEMPVCSV